MSKVGYWIVGIIVVVGGGYYLWHQSAGGGMMTQSSQTMSQLLASGQSVTCKFDNNNAGQNSTGTVYVSGGKMRADVVANVNGSSVNAHVLYADGEMYTWSDAMASGVKFAAPNGVIAGSAPSQAADLQTKSTYNCAPWSNDGSLTPPSNISFNDMSSMMPGAGASAAGSVGTGGGKCGVCNSLPASARVQCLAAMQCN